MPLAAIQRKSLKRTRFTDRTVPGLRKFGRVAKLMTKAPDKSPSLRRSGKREDQVLKAVKTLLSISAITVLGALPAAGPGAAASPPNLAGTYSCQPSPAPCFWPGHGPSITQSGTNLHIKSDQGDISTATLTSDTTISAGPTFNSIGLIRPDHSIDWSNGTKWRKQ
jgi:hypothetical protein